MHVYVATYVAMYVCYVYDWMHVDVWMYGAMPCINVLYVPICICVFVDMCMFVRVLVHVNTM